MTDKFVPITYYPVVMQRQFENAKQTLAGSPYAKYLNEVLTVPEAAALSVQHGPMDPKNANLPTVQGLNELISGQVKSRDSGYCVLEGPTLYVQSRVSFPGGTPEMFEWWFWWHALDARRYMLWFPYSHIEARVQDAQRAGNNSLSYAERVYENPHHVVEYMGPDLFESTIRFTDPVHLGIDREQMKKGGYTASASALLEVPGVPGVTVGIMIHMVRPSTGGMELLSRYYLGAHPALKRFPNAQQAPAVLHKGGLTAERLEYIAYELAIHDMTEWNNLAKLLPRLYAEFGHES
jgi:hypothetical protein